jgi:hypothetical protein
LKNAGPTFCITMKAILKSQISRNMYTYIHNIDVASKKKSTQIECLVETFANMCRSQLKLKKNEYSVYIEEKY